jgi:23S rRNA pseudouridine1911/1915/1917 synthase
MSKTKIEVIYQDHDILVVNKPAGVSVTKDRSGAAELADILAGQLGAQISSGLRLVHRLDKDTSGIMILARNKEAQSLFCSLFEKKLVKKTYLALVTGAISAQKGTISAPLARSRKNPALMCIAAKKGKEAVTDWELLADFGIAALLGVSPLTGRTHQIRVHLSSIGLPLLIDPLYGNGRPLFLSDFKTNYRLTKGQTEKPLMERLTLHAYQLSFRAELQKPIPSFRAEPQEPIPSFRAEPKAESRNLFNNSSSRPNCFIASLDKRFTACLKMLTKHNPNGPDAFIKPDNFSKIINTQRLY